MDKLSVVIITLNEEATLARCITSLQSIADEIIVLDSFSTDRTVELAKQNGAITYQQKFEGFTHQKNSVIALANYKFIFSIDADEVLSETLLNAIKQIKREGFNADAYQMNRLNFIGDRAIKTCGWYPDVKVRIWNKEMAEWKGQLVHETFGWKTKPGKVETLDGDLLHFSFGKLADFAIQLNRFSKLAAQDLSSQNSILLFVKMIFSPVIKFIRMYFMQAGFTDGWLGFKICMYAGRATFLKYYWALNYPLYK